eukprot:TRINITY_DN8391_c0_g3_i1.p1 TRINITY_DN8391_c0_g3~~TRINITY_DN8391_c0_g3_i1.p1  ORF type:complete len:131 (+),score=19.27 TRINITY_DN8391_c0_g3_i1:236-628(+)
MGYPDDSTGRLSRSFLAYPEQIVFLTLHKIDSTHPEQSSWFVPLSLIMGLCFPKTVCGILTLHLIGRAMVLAGIGQEFELQRAFGNWFIALSSSAIVMLSALGGVKVLRYGKGLSPITFAREILKFLKIK